MTAKELLLISFLALAAVFYLNAVDRTMVDMKEMVKESVEVIEDNDKRLGRIERVVSEVPGMKRDIEEIKVLLKKRRWND